MDTPIAEQVELCESCGGPKWERDSRNHRRPHTNCWARILAQRNALAAQVAIVTQERDTARLQVAGLLEEYDAACIDRDRYREALEQIVKGPDGEGDSDPWIGMQWGLDTARAALFSPAIAQIETDLLLRRP